MSTPEPRMRQAGVSLVEVILFIVIVSLAVAGVLLVMDRTARTSVDPLLTKQALAIAEALLDEVELAPFTFCDPDDANVLTATAPVVGANGCATTVEAIGPEAGETRYSPPTFDNVNDYHGFNMAGIRDITNTPIAALSSYSASVTVATAALGSIPAAGDALLITVTVTGPGNASVVLQGYRTRYAPNSTP